MNKISEHRTELMPCINFWRESAEREICGQMEDFFENLGKILCGFEAENGEELEFDKPVSRFTVPMLKKAKESFESGSTGEWIGNAGEAEKAELMMAFLDFDGMKMSSFRERYPNSFKKWSEEEDRALLNTYSSFPGRVQWSTLSQKFGRNANALKLRLEKLGIELGADAGNPHYTR